MQNYNPFTPLQSRDIFEELTGKVSKREDSINHVRFRKAKELTYEDILAVSPINSGISFIRDTIISLPLNLYNKKGVLVDKNPNLDLLNSPNPLQSKADFIGQLIDQYFIYGNAFVYAKDGQLICLEGDAKCVEIGINRNRRPVYTLSGAFKNGGFYRRLEETTIVNHINMLHFKRNNTFGLYGAGVIHTLESEIRILLNLQNKNATFALDNNNQYVLTTIDTPTKRTEHSSLLAQSLLNKTTSVYGLKVGETLTSLPTNTTSDVKQDKLMQQMINFIAADIKIPVSYIGSDTNDKHNNGLLKRRLMLDSTLQPLCKKICEVFNNFFFPNSNYYLEFDTDQFIKGDLASESTIYINLHNAGITTTNETRKALNYGKIEGDQYDLPRQGAPMQPAGEPTGGADGPGGAENRPDMIGRDDVEAMIAEILSDSSYLQEINKSEVT